MPDEQPKVAEEEQPKAVADQRPKTVADVKAMMIAKAAAQTAQAAQTGGVAPKVDIIDPATSTEVPVDQRKQAKPDKK